eukprot:271566_1
MCHRSDATSVPSLNYQVSASRPTSLVYYLKMVFTGKDHSKHRQLSEFVDQDPNWVSQEERDALSDLKELAVCKYNIFRGNDKLLYAFLFARKLDVKRTANLMQKYFNLRRKLNRLYTLRLEDLNPALVNSGMLFEVPGCVDRCGRSIGYVNAGNFPLDRSPGIDDMLDFICFRTDWMIENTPLHVLRMGVTFIMDLNGLGFSHMLLLRMFIQVQNKMESCFPFRIRNILVVNPGWMLKVGVSMAKIGGVKMKILNRIQSLEDKELTKHIAKDNLISKFGGSLAFSYKEWLDEEMGANESGYFSQSSFSDEEKIDV